MKLYSKCLLALLVISTSILQADEFAENCVLLALDKYQMALSEYSNAEQCYDFSKQLLKTQAIYRAKNNLAPRSQDFERAEDCMEEKALRDLAFSSAKQARNEFKEVFKKYGSQMNESTINKIGMLGQSKFWLIQGEELSNDEILKP